MKPVAVITGTTHGIGRVTARELARAGHHVVMLCRDAAASLQVAQEIRAAVPGASLEHVRCDLSSLDSVRRAAEQVLAQPRPLALLVNNAGMAPTRRAMSVDGVELSFATNHLGPFLLTELLRPRLAPGGRIVTVASRAHLRPSLPLASVTDPTARFSSVAAYARSKLANVQYSFALARRVSDLSVNCLHPGIVASHLLPGWLRLVKPLISGPMFDVERVRGRRYSSRSRRRPRACTAATSTSTSA